MKLRKYECVMVLHPGLSDADTQAIVDRFQSSVSTHGGEVSLHDHWGRRELAYIIEKQTSGDYHLFKFTADNALVESADRDLRLDDRVLRHLFVVDEEWAERNRASMAKRAGRKSTDGEDDADEGDDEEE